MVEADIYRNYNFILYLGSEPAGYFTRVTGLGLKVSCIEYREGGTPNAVRKLPGQVTVSPVTLEWGVTQSRAMWDWLMSAANGTVERKEVSVVVIGNDPNEEKVRWNFGSSWLCEWSGTNLDSSGNNVAIESMVLQAESVERAPDVSAAPVEE
jgi:phage tail-like protein